jgi:hypothetical protein
MNTATNQQTTTPILSTVPQFCTKHPFITQGGLRFQIFNEENNGLAESGAIVRIGRRVLINEPKYFGWIESVQKRYPGRRVT